MNEAPETEREPDGYIRLPWQLVGGVLFVFLAALLAFGLFANRNLRPQLGVVPASTLLADATSTPAPVAAATAVQVSTQTAATQVSTPTPLPTVVPTQPPAAVIQSSATATASPAATPRPTVSPELAAEVSSAYQHYWQVRAEALFDLDTSHLSEVMAGEHLAAVESLIDELRGEGHAIQTDVNHKYAVVHASSTDAEIADMYTDSSVYVDAQSHAVLSQPTNDVLEEEYRMSRIDGTWRVVSLARAP